MTQISKLENKALFYFRGYPHYAHTWNVKCYYMGFERDVLIFNHKRLATEVEIKRSNNDLIADLNKEEKHLQTETGQGVSQFYYLLDYGVRLDERLPDWAGILTLQRDDSLKLLKKAEIMNRYPVTFDELWEHSGKLATKKTIIER